MKLVDQPVCIGIVLNHHGMSIVKSTLDVDLVICWTVSASFGTLARDDSKHLLVLIVPSLCSPLLACPHISLHFTLLDFTLLHFTCLHVQISALPLLPSASVSRYLHPLLLLASCCCSGAARV